MPTKSKKSSKAPKRGLDLARRQLLSGNEKHFLKARAFLGAHRADLNAMALSLQDEIKRWIENNESGKVKSIGFLENIISQAKKGAADEIALDWYSFACIARALRYGGRFNKACRLYERAIRNMGTFGAGDRDDDRCAVLADYAEFWAYLGYCGKALGILRQIPKGAETAWVHWVHAFVLHQAAFTDLFPVGSPALPVGIRALYEQSNAKLTLARDAKIKDPLSDKETADTSLLEAANWGGIGRTLRAEGAKESDCTEADNRATAALAKFRSYLDDPVQKTGVNQFWTLRKERRGMMVKRWIRGIDPPGTASEEKAIAIWRSVLVDHFRLNLTQAGVKPKTSGVVPDRYVDGDEPDLDDPGDDD